MNTKIKEESQIEKICTSCENYKKAYESKYLKFSKLGSWLLKESAIFRKESSNLIFTKPNFKRGEIIKADFGINIGSELSNTHFAIVLNKDDNNMVDNITVLPLTSKKGYKRLNLGNLLSVFNDEKYNKNTYALITQITTISKEKVFKLNTKYYCSNEILNLIDNEIVKFLTHKK